MNFYKRFMGDYQRDTGHLSITEHGAYTLMLDAHYATERPLPANIDALCRMLRAISKDERAAVESVLHQFWQLTPDGWINPRVSKEIMRAQEFSNAQSKRAHTRWNAGDMPAHMPAHTGDASRNDASHSHSHSQTPQPEPKPDKGKTLSASAAPTLRTKKGKSLKGEHLERFEKFWIAFAYKRGKAEAADSWYVLSPDAALSETITAAASREAKRRPSLTAAGQTPKMAQGWLSARRFEDEDAPALPAAKNGNGAVPPVTDEKGLLAYGARFGLTPRAGEQWNQFRSRVMQASR